ncbi:MAG TPA: hypothetical protein VHB45_13000 [Alloacidobacterium sp.]|nr:hypothetical protein [Alloacidobacterium sp.]
MSWENLRDAYRTKLENPTAKSVLVLIVDEANAEGLALAGISRIAELTEVSERTVTRLVQVFVSIGLLERSEVWFKGRLRPALKVNLAMLGGDLAAVFDAAYTAAQSKRRTMDGGLEACGNGRSDEDENVAATVESVAATGKGVAATLPPHPLLGISPLVPLMSPPPVVPQGGTCGRDSPLQGSLEHAVDQVCNALSIARARKRRRRLLRDVIALEMTKGQPPPTIALAMVAAWHRQIEMGPYLRVKLGIDKFFGDGYWKDEDRWFWDEQRLREARNARVGCM